MSLDFPVADSTPEFTLKDATAKDFGWTYDIGTEPTLWPAKFRCALRSSIPFRARMTEMTHMHFFEFAERIALTEDSTPSLLILQI